MSNISNISNSLSDNEFANLSSKEKEQYIYIISKAQNEHDSDMWQFWTTYIPISYHASLDGANNKICSLIEEELEKLLKKSKGANECIALVKNIVIHKVGNGDEFEAEDVELFRIKEQKLLD